MTGRRELRVVLYSWPFAPGIGGLERLTAVTAELLAAAGHSVSVITATPDVGPTRVARPYEVVRRPGPATLVRLVRSADVVHLNTFHPLVVLVARSAGIPILWQHIDYDTVSPRGICVRYGPRCVGDLAMCYRCLRQDGSRSRSLRMLASLLVRRAGRHLVDAHAVSTDYARRRMGLDDALPIALGVDIRALVPAPRDDPPPLRILFCARHIVAKGCDVLLAAARYAIDAGVDLRLRIVGDGPHRRASEALARDLGLRDAAFLGHLSDDVLRRELQLAHVAVVPSLQDEIALFAVSEAMACGTAVVASEIGALPDQVGDAGIAVPAGNAQALSATLARLARSPQLVADLGRRGRERAVSQFDARTMVDRYVAAYGKLLAAGR